MSTSNNGDSLKKKVSIPVDIEIQDGRSAYALSLQMIFRHVADFHMTVVDVISEKYNIPVDDIMNAVTSDSRYKNMVVDKDLHRLSTHSTVVGVDVGVRNESEQKKEEQQEQEMQLPKPKPKPTIIKKIKIKPKVKQMKSPTKNVVVVAADGVEQCD
uniref:Uncharacterized protein n=1 Tax=viral metagenome TaxID=1070528 RepID=A0A6C0F511_9ZZZZ